MKAWCDLEGFFGGERFLNIVALILQDECNDVDEFLLIFNEQDVLHGGQSFTLGGKNEFRSVGMKVERDGRAGVDAEHIEKGEIFKNGRVSSQSSNPTPTAFRKSP